MVMVNFLFDLFLLAEIYKLDNLAFYFPNYLYLLNEMNYNFQNIFYENYDYK